MTLLHWLVVIAVGSGLLAVLGVLVLGSLASVFLGGLFGERPAGDQERWDPDDLVEEGAAGDTPPVKEARQARRERD
jgi:hypothetical protein